jgi:hypothetical protein
MRMNGTIRRTAWMVVAAALTGCLSPYEGSGEGEGTLPVTGQPAAEASALFSDEGSGDDGRRVTRFYTADRKYRTVRGYTLWTAGDGTEGTAFTDRTVVVRKATGNMAAGYGVVICEGVRPVGGVNERVFLTVLVNNQGEYAAGKVYGGRYESLIWWTRDEALLAGSGVGNEIRIVRDGVDPNRYHVHFNGTEVTTLTDSEGPRCGGIGRSGYVVVIAPDDLAGAGVEAWFEE